MPDQIRPSSPAMSTPASDPHPAPPPAASQLAESGTQPSLPSPQNPNPKISTPLPQNASPATTAASAAPSQSTPAPTNATVVPSRQAPGVTAAAGPSRNASGAALTTISTRRRKRSRATAGITAAAMSQNPSARVATTDAVPRHPSVATAGATAAAVFPNPSARAAVRDAVPRHPPVATAAMPPQDLLGAAVVSGAPPWGPAPTRPEDYTPRIGMEFDSEQEAYEFYRYYGWMVGFNVRKDYGNRSKKTGEITSRRFSCSREGYRTGSKAASKKRGPKPDSRTGCYAHLVIRRKKPDSKKLEVYVFQPRHNHPLFPASSMPCPLPGTGTTANDSVQPLDYLGNGGEPSGVQNSTEGDIAVCAGQGPRQHLRTRRQREMQYGEAGALLNYFREQSLAEPSFYHAMQLDVEDKVANFFWADGRMMVDYTQFGDVVAFDVVSRNGTSGRRFASFVGVNNFGEPIVFALALMYDETAESFQWLFETFLHAMSGEAPETFFSHHDPVIEKAVSLVMPNTSHAICAWNLKQDAKKILNQLGRGEGDCIKEFKACINEYEEEAEFLTSWNAMINNHNLSDNLWFQKVFDEKEKWARPYVKGIFSAGMKGTQLNERLHSDVRDNLRAGVNIILFLRHLQKVINDMRYKEREIECSSRLKLPFFKIKAPILVQASEAYTSTIFQLFQEEYEEFQSAYIVSRDESGPCREYTVSIVEKEKQYTVYGNPTEPTVSCSCRKFEAVGFLCSHALKVLDAMDIKYLPDRYIMERWTKYARCLISPIAPDQTYQTDELMDFSSRYQHMCQKYARLIARASECDETYRVLDKIWSELGKKVDGILQMQTSIEASMIQPDVQDLMLSLNSIANGAGQGSFIDKSNRKTAKESKKGQKNKIQPRNCIEKGLRKKQKVHTKQPSIPLLSNASVQSENALSEDLELEAPPNMISVGSHVPSYRPCRGIDLSNSMGPINYEAMHSGLNLTFTPDGFATYHTSQLPSNSQYNQVNDSGGL